MSGGAISPSGWHCHYSSPSLRHAAVSGGGRWARNSELFLSHYVAAICPTVDRIPRCDYQYAHNYCGRAGMAEASAGHRRRREKSDRPNPIDVHVGGRIRLRRTLLGMSQERLGEALGLTFQQVQKYERGANRVGASRLYRLSQILDVPVSFFFEDISPETAGAPSGGAGIASAGTVAALPESETVMRRETLELVQ